jgi:response regulator of citrate/malate metabolism
MNNHHIFLVEDDPTLAGIVSAKLKQIPGAIITVFPSAEKALGNIALRPDFIVLDHFLEKTNGVDCIPVFREFLPNAQIFVFSNQNSIEVFENAFSNGAHDYFRKDGEGILHLHEKISSTIRKKEIVKKDSVFNFRSFFTSAKTSETRMIYVLEDNTGYAFALEFSPSASGTNSVLSFSDVYSFWAECSRLSPDTIVLDYDLLDKQNGLDLVRMLSREHPFASLIIISSQKELKVAEQLMREGVHQYITKSDDSIRKLKIAVERVPASLV